MEHLETDGRGRKGQSRRRGGGREKRGGCLLPAAAAVLLLAVLAAGIWLLAGPGREPELVRETPAEIHRETMAPAEWETKEEARAPEEGGGNRTPEEILAEMTLEEKIFQLFMVTPEALTGVDEVYAAGETTRAAIAARPVGGIVYFKKNLRGPQQTAEMLGRTKDYFEETAGILPFLGIDEEGGTVARISGREEFGIAAIPDMRDVAQEGGADGARRIGEQIGSYLAELGFNLDFAPVADVLTNAENPVVARRSFGSDAQLAADCACAVAEGLQSQGILPVFKHFPGHGGTAQDSHDGFARTERTKEELYTEDFLPFEAGIAAGVPVIMAGHISAPALTGDAMPASLSPVLTDGILRGELGFQGVVVTDALDMGAITQSWSPAEAAVLALEAGCDLLLMPENLDEAFGGVKAAVEEGRLSEERIDGSVLRILRAKQGLS